MLAILMAATGLHLAARPDAVVELLPGSPTTVVLAVAGRARATFVLPLAREDVGRALGQAAGPRRDLALERLWYEDQRDRLDQDELA